MKRITLHRNIFAIACVLLVATTAFPKQPPKKRTAQSKKLRKRTQQPKQQYKRGKINKFLHLVTAGGMISVVKHLFETGKHHYLNPRSPVADPENSNKLIYPSEGVVPMCAIMGTTCVLATYFLIKDAFFEKQLVKQRKESKEKKSTAEQVEQTESVAIDDDDNSDFELFLDRLQKKDRELNIDCERIVQEQELNPVYDIQFEIAPEEQEEIAEEADTKIDFKETELNTQEELEEQAQEEDNLEPEIIVTISADPKKDILKAVTTAGQVEENSQEPEDSTQEEQETTPVEQPSEQSESISESIKVEKNTTSEIVDEYIKIEKEINNLNEQFDAMVQNTQDILECDENQTSIFDA